jgi:hypothetical protein
MGDFIANISMHRHVSVLRDGVLPNVLIEDWIVGTHSYGIEGIESLVASNE